MDMYAMQFDETLCYSLTAFLGAVFIIAAIVYLLEDKKKPDSSCEDDLKISEIMKFFMIDNHFHDKVCNVAFLESAESLTKEILLEALNFLYVRNPMMRMRIVKEDDNDYRLHGLDITEGKELIDLKMLDNDGDEWQDIMEEELLTHFDLNSHQPLWHVRCLRSSFDSVDKKYSHFLMFTYHHLICDGVSTMAVFKQLMKYLDIASEGNFSIESMERLPPLSKLLSHVLLPRALWREYFDKLCSFFLCIALKYSKSPSNPYCKKFPPLDKEPRTKIVPMSLTEEETRRLVKACKDRGCTVNGAITAAAAIGMARLMQDGEVKTTMEIPSGCLVSLRKECCPNVDDEYVGVYFSGMSLSTKILPPLSGITHSPDEFWQISKDVCSDVRTKMLNKKHLEFVSAKNKMLPHIKIMIDKTKREPGARMPHDLFNVTNRTRFVVDPEKKYKFQMTGLYFLTAGHTMGTPMQHNMVTVNGRLFWSYQYYTHITTKEQALEYISDIFCKLKQVIDEYQV